MSRKKAVSHGWSTGFPSSKYVVCTSLLRRGSKGFFFRVDPLSNVSAGTELQATAESAGASATTSSPGSSRFTIWRRWEKTLAHSELTRSLIGAFYCAFIRALSLVYSSQNKNGCSLGSSWKLRAESEA